jgi:polyhydroxybutyrate depolymerase
MTLKKYCVIALVAIMAMVLPAGSTVVAQEYSPGFHTGWMLELGGDNITYNRTYEYYIPSSYDGSEAVPLLFSFHGLGSNPEGQIELTKFGALAEQEGFIAVFPEATALDPQGYPDCAQYLPELPGANIMWNIGLNWTLQYCADIDDVGFVSDMLDWFEIDYNIDESRIYATGMSNGAMFSYYVALMLPGTFAGIAPVCSPMTVNGFEFEGVPPLTMIMMMGTADPIVNYDGSPYAYGSMDDTVTFWLDADNIASGPVETVWGPASLDSTVVHRYAYSGGTDGTEVIFFKVDEGGHTWPGGPLYSAYVGTVTTHIDGSALIWRHLPPEKYYLEMSSTLGGDVTTPGQNTFANIESTGAYMFFYPGTGDTVVDLEAVPKSDSWEFVNWTGDVSTIADINAATTTITVTPDRDYEITANFQVKSAEPEPEPEPTPSGGMCFIATAAYGTSTAKQLDVLREFRDDVLLENPVGSRLVDLYYQVSPPVAEFISEGMFVRTLVKELLIDPIAWVVEATGDMWRN